jgi:deazaflavin-dependent oxidoreductase (nitroreductase family)
MFPKMPTQYRGSIGMETSMTTVNPQGVADKQVLYLTTIGRRTGLPRQVEIWFVVYRERFYLFAEMGEAAGWVKNIRHNHNVTVRVGEWQLAATARLLDHQADRWTSTNRYVIHGTGKWVDDHLSREPIVVFVAEIVIGPTDHPDGLLSKLVRYGLDQCTGFSCREAGCAELNHLLIRFIFLDHHLALGLVGDGDVRDLLALDMSIDGVIAPLMYFMLAIGVDVIPEQLMRREMLVFGKRHSSEGQDTD